MSKNYFEHCNYILIPLWYYIHHRRMVANVISKLVRDLVEQCRTAPAIIIPNELY